MNKIIIILCLIIFQAFNLFSAADNASKYVIDSFRYNKSHFGSGDTLNLSYMNLSDNDLEVILNNNIFVKKDSQDIKVDLNKIVSINLSYNNLTRIPEKIFSLNLQDLRMSNNHIKEIPDLINGFRNLKFLNLSNNKISQRPDFNDLEKLSDINLSNNLLEDVPQINPNQSTVKIGVKLNLSSNLIATISSDIFSKITDLDLSNNKIKNLPNYRSNNIKVLNLGDNDIEEFPEQLANMRSLETIYLNNNKIKNLDMFFIWSTGTLMNVNLLDLSFNDLSKETFSYRVGQVEKIRFYLHGNSLKLEDLKDLNIACKPFFSVNKSDLEDRLTCSDMKSVNLSGLPVDLTDLIDLKVKYIDQNNKALWMPLTNVPKLGLDLSGCSLTDTSLASPLFNRLADLNTLNLDNNAITFIDHFKIYNLKKLSLNNNNLKSVVFYTDPLENLSLNGNKELSSISIFGNKLKSLEAANCNLEKVIIEQLGLEHINLSDNKISVFPDLTKSGNLQEIYLGHNKIKDLPKYLFIKLPKLRLLDLEDNSLGKDSKQLLEDNQKTLTSRFEKWLKEEDKK